MRDKGVLSNSDVKDNNIHAFQSKFAPSIGDNFGSIDLWRETTSSSGVTANIGSNFLSQDDVPFNTCVYVCVCMYVYVCLWPYTFIIMIKLVCDNCLVQKEITMNTYLQVRSSG